MFSGVTGLVNRGKKLKGTVVLMRKNVLDINALTSAQSATGIIGGAIGVVGGVIGSTVDTLTSFLGRSVALKLISATAADGNHLLFLLLLWFLCLSLHCHSNVVTHEPDTKRII